MTVVPIQDAWFSLPSQAHQSSATTSSNGTPVLCPSCPQDENGGDGAIVELLNRLGRRSWRSLGRGVLLARPIK